jgi:hypothetical protein
MEYIPGDRVFSVSGVKSGEFLTVISKRDVDNNYATYRCKYGPNSTDICVKLEKYILPATEISQFLLDRIERG